MITTEKWKHPLWVVAAVSTGLLCIPLIAMQFTDAVDWSPGDFLLGALLLLSAGTAMVFCMCRARTLFGRTAAVSAITGILVALWLQLAVGLL